MAVHLPSGAGNYLQRTTAVLPVSGPRTWAAWVKQDTIPTGVNYNTAFASLNNTPAAYTHWGGIFLNASGIGNDLSLNVTGGVNSTSTATVGAGVWRYMAWVTGGTTIQRLNQNGVQTGNFTLDLSTLAPVTDVLGGDSFGIGGVTVAYCRQWTVALTAAELLIEMQSTTAVKTASLYMDCPLTADLLDISGNGHNWTQVGTSTFTAAPSFPSNSSAATAMPFSTLPQTITQSFGDGVYAWYSYTGIPKDVLVGFWAFSGLSDTLTSLIQYGSPASLTILNTAVNVPFELPTDGGDTFYWSVSSGAVPPTANVVVSGQLSPTNAVPVGSLVINDDGNFSVVGDSQTTVFPAAFLNGLTGATLAFAKAAAGEAGTVLPTTGKVCLADFATETVQLFDATLGTPTIIHPNTDFSANGSAAVISSDQTTQFYIGGFSSAGTSHVKTLSPAGVIGTTDYAIPTTVGTLFKTLAPSIDNTILYYALDSVGAAVKRWDLVNNVALADFLAGVASHTLCADTLVLGNTHVVLGHKKTAAVFDDSVIVYDAAATPLVTVTIGPHILNRMAHAIDDPTSFWIWIYLTSGGVQTGVDRFVNVKSSDGSTITTFDVADFEGGVYRAAATASPIRFGNSFSCPFWIQREGITPTPVKTGDPTTIRRERIFRHLSDEQQWIFYQWLQVDAEAGVGLSTGQGSDPEIMVQWSDDGGHTWSNERFLKIGKQGEYSKRAMLRQLGRSRDRVWKVAYSDPTKFALLNAYFEAQKGTS